MNKPEIIEISEGAFLMAFRKNGKVYGMQVSLKKDFKRMMPMLYNFAINTLRKHKLPSPEKILIG